MKLVKLALFALLSLNILAKENENKNNNLKFNINNYTKKSVEINGKTIEYRAFEKIVYVKNPVDIEYQNMNIYIPEEYFNNKSIGNYNAKNAPIFLPNMVGGYMPGNAREVGIDNRTGKANSISYALSRGYVVASPAVRGRTLEDKDGKYTGKAPAAIVDLKAAVRYLKYNDDIMQGDANKIVSNGTSAGGALSSLLGASGNSKDYLPYLKAIGAADTKDDIFAVSAYCPILNLENADTAYEWTFNGVNNFTRMLITRSTSAEEFNNRTIKREKISGTLTENEIKISDELKNLFPAYLNSLKLKDKNGNLLTLENENGTFKEYLKKLIVNSLNKVLKDGKDLSSKTFFEIENGEIKNFDWNGYIHSEDRMKSPPAFDSLSMDSGENNLFGDETTDNKHFTEFSYNKNNKENIAFADPKIVSLMNPMNYVASKNNTVQHWRIRHGASDRDTALAIPAIFALKLENSEKNVDFFVPWGQGHGGDYDLEELFDWIDNIVK